jgi:hypothetical protein
MKYLHFETRRVTSLTGTISFETDPIAIITVRFLVCELCKLQIMEDKMDMVFTTNML